ncbi:unnamed protein product [Cochlearia groenlandica]
MLECSVPHHPSYNGISIHGCLYYQAMVDRCIELWVLVDAEKHEWSKRVYVFPPLWRDVVRNAGLSFMGMKGSNKIVLSSRLFLSVFAMYIRVLLCFLLQFREWNYQKS